ncbi:MAG: polyprenyl synthetase family protein, partial [Myxococcales bacterium]|nr:polyprenyl synthetase family protein [Myxococcales bacterium]
MTSIAALSVAEGHDVISGLRSVCANRSLPALERRLAELAELVRWDLGAVNAGLAALEFDDLPVRASARHLVDLGGKRLRPICVALAAKVGRGFEAAALEHAIAAELVHSATLLHDDVVDLGDRRRGEPAARSVWGNAASIFAGDWLLIEALRRVRAAGVPGTLEHLLEIIDEMIQAES